MFVLFAFIAVPLLVDEYLFRAILIPFLILSLAALGVNILVGYCGQITLGAGAFMAVGAYAAYNFHIRIEGMPLLLSLLLGGLTAAIVGIFFGIPSLRVGRWIIAGLDISRWLRNRARAEPGRRLCLRALRRRRRRRRTRGTRPPAPR